jgi:hypothetical protein
MKNIFFMVLMLIATRFTFAGDSFNYLLIGNEKSVKQVNAVFQSARDILALNFGLVDNPMTLVNYKKSYQEVLDQVLENNDFKTVIDIQNKLNDYNANATIGCADHMNQLFTNDILTVEMNTSIELGKPEMSAAASVSGVSAFRSTIPVGNSHTLYVMTNIMNPKVPGSLTNTFYQCSSKEN